jgi:phosphotransferase system HPr (HPr) family protein
MKRVELTVTNEVGLHARPAAVFVKTAARYKSNIQVRNISRNQGWVNAKSILKVLGLGVEKNHQVEISTEGQDEAEALQALEGLVRSDFKE